MDGVVTEDGVNVQNRVVVGQNQEVEHVPILVLLMVANNVLVQLLRTETVALRNVPVRPSNINPISLFSIFDNKNAGFFG